MWQFADHKWLALRRVEDRGCVRRHKINLGVGVPEDPTFGALDWATAQRLCPALWPVGGTDAMLMPHERPARWARGPLPEPLGELTEPA